jgi:hypothetical protein
MTKKTDALIFRYGIKTLWQNNIYLFKISISSHFFFKFLHSSLEKRSIELLSIKQENFDTIYAFIFCFFWKSWKISFTYNTMTLLLKIIRFYRYWFLSQLLYGYIFFMRWNFFLRLPLMNLVSLCIKGISTYISNYNYPILYKRLNILFLKIEQLRLESGLSLAFKRNIHITLQNIFNLNIYFDFIKFSKKKNKYFSSIFNNIRIYDLFNM